MDAIARRDAANIPPAAIAAVRAGVDCLMVLGSLTAQRRCFDALLAAAEDGTIPGWRLDEAVDRVRALRERVTLPTGGAAWPDNAHRRAAQDLARATVTCVRDEAGLLPVRGPGLGVIEFAFGGVSPVEADRNQPLGASTLALLLGRHFPDARFLALYDRAPDPAVALARFLLDSEQIVVATRNAVLDPGQTTLLGQIAAAGKPVIHVALRSPYDATLAPTIGTVLLTYGDPPPSLAAVVDVLVGAAPAAGRLPVRLSEPPRR
jgi:beta-N-acetylhexosaminidase